MMSDGEQSPASLPVLLKKYTRNANLSGTMLPERFLQFIRFGSVEWRSGKSEEFL